MGWVGVTDIAQCEFTTDFANFHAAYDWVRWQMVRSIPGYTGRYPMWVWTRNSRSRLINQLRVARRQQRGDVLLTMLIPREQILVTDFNAWHLIAPDTQRITGHTNRLPNLRHQTLHQGRLLERLVRRLGSGMDTTDGTRWSPASCRMVDLAGTATGRTVQHVEGRCRHRAQRGRPSLRRNHSRHMGHSRIPTRLSFHLPDRYR
jgi:hypothetical protein